MNWFVTTLFIACIQLQVESGAEDEADSDWSDNGDWVEDWFENEDTPD